MTETVIQLRRRWFNPQATIGELFLDNDVYRQCYTLEDVTREEKIPEKTAIPVGRYRVVLSYSNRFGKLVPWLLNVPNFEDIYIHNGNTSEDTHGCILVGRTIVNADFIGDSRTAFSDLYAKLDAANRRGKIFMNIVNARIV